MKEDQINVLRDATQEYVTRMCQEDPEFLQMIIEDYMNNLDEQDCADTLLNAGSDEEIAKVSEDLGVPLDSLSFDEEDNENVVEEIAADPPASLRIARANVS
jgi:hypothetical protein